VQITTIGPFQPGACYLVLVLAAVAWAWPVLGPPAPTPIRAPATASA
jgi:hypothetical protein